MESVRISGIDTLTQKRPKCFVVSSFFAIKSLWGISWISIIILVLLKELENVYVLIINI